MDTEIEDGEETGFAEEIPDDTVDDDEPAERSISPRQEKLVAALLTQPDIQSAAKTAGVGSTTAHRWLKQPAFQEALTHQRDELMRESLSSVKIHAGRAVRELSRLLDNPDARLRRMVCNDILQHVVRVHEMLDIDVRLLALEKEMAREKKARRWN